MTQKKVAFADSAMNSKAATVQKHNTIIIKNHPEFEGQMYQVLEVKRDGSVRTNSDHIFYPEFFDIVSDWQQYNGGVARFNLTTGELVEEESVVKVFRDREKVFHDKDRWVSLIVLEADTGLDKNKHLKSWLTENEGILIERNPNPKDPDYEEWRLISSVTSGDEKLSTNEREPLTEALRERLQYLESLIEASFVVVGRSLKEIRDTRLYRDRHANFDSYCRAKWKFTKDKAKNLIDASEVYETIRVSMTTNCRQQNDEDSLILPKTESQLRPIARAHLEPERQVTAWTLSVAENQNKMPTAKIVEKVVKEMTQGKKDNPWKVGDVCKYVGVTGKSNVWCVVQVVGEYACVVDDYREKDVQVRPDELKEMEISTEEKQFMRDLLPQLQSLSDTDDDMALHTLSFFGKLNRGYLSDKEEAILKVLED